VECGFPLFVPFNWSFAMTLIREIGSVLFKTVLVTLAVALGFSLGDWLDLPFWLQGVAIIPAGYLFFRLNGEAPPPVRKWLPSLLGLTLLLFLFSFVYPHVPEGWQMAAIFCFLMLAPNRLNFFQPRTS
jgi:hypothetical protein